MKSCHLLNDDVVTSLIIPLEQGGTTGVFFINFLKKLIFIFILKKQSIGMEMNVFLKEVLLYVQFV